MTQSRNSHQEQMRDALSPYRAGFPNHPALGPGTVVSSQNWQIAQDVLPPEVLTRVQEGDFSIEVAPTRDFPLQKHYRAATLEYAPEVHLDEYANLANYTAGLPFPVIDQTDSLAGLKLAWNLRFRSLGGDSEELRVMLTMMQGAEVEGSQEMRMQRLRVAHRAIAAPQMLSPNPLALYHVTLAEMGEPPQLQGWQSVTYRYADDRQADDTWVYTPAQVTAVKSDYHSEDGYGYSGSVASQQWRYLGETVVLAPVGIQRSVASFGGRNGWYPSDPYQLRRAHVLEATAKDPGHHYARRVFYVDAQLWMPFYTLGYNRRGEYFKLVFHMFGDPAFHPWTPQHQGPINLGACAINYVRNHATLLPNIEQRFQHNVAAHPFFEAALAGRTPVEASHPERDGFGWIAIGHTARITEIVPDRLYQSGLPSERELAQKGIDAIVNLSGRTHVSFSGHLSVTWPIEDDDVPDAALLHSLSRWVADLLRTTDKKVLVHCVASVNRSSLVIGCILHEYLGLGGESLIRYLEEHSGDYAILTNQRFRQYLQSLS